MQEKLRSRYPDSKWNALIRTIRNEDEKRLHFCNTQPFKLIEQKVNHTLILAPNEGRLRVAGFPQAESRAWGPIKGYSVLRKVFRLSDITGHQCRDSGLAMDNPQLAKASPQLSLHPALIPPYCNQAFVPREWKKRKRGGCWFPKEVGSREGLRQGERGSKREWERGAEIEEYEWEQIG